MHNPTTELHVELDDFNTQYTNPAEAVQECGYQDGTEFTLVRIAVSAATRYRVVNGKAQPVALMFPELVQDG